MRGTVPRGQLIMSRCGRPRRSPRTRIAEPATARDSDRARETDMTIPESEPGRRGEPGAEVIGVARADWRARIVEQPGGRPRRIDGFSVGAPLLTGGAP